jgi:PucR C-terminal helix-turn-helix domain/GGDEF-like domain
MSGSEAAVLAGSDAVRAERERILLGIRDGIDAMVDDCVLAIRTEIPAYTAIDDERFFVDVRDQVERHYRLQLQCLLEDRPVTVDDLSFVRGASMRRARAGFALQSYINAYYVGQQVFWDRIVAHAGDTLVGHEAALELATPMMRYCDFASMQAAQVYVEFHQHVVADADRERRDLLEHLLAGDMPARGPLLAAAHGYGIAAESALLVAAAIPVGPSADRDAPYAASAALASAVSRETRALVVVRQGEIVVVSPVGPGGDVAAACACLEAAHERLRRAGTPLSMGIGTVAAGVAELPRAYAEANAALETLGDDVGVAALPRLSPFEFLALRAEDTARRLVDPRLRSFLDDDRARGGVLTATIRAFAEADLNLRVAAERLQIHPNTAQYRLRRIEERTGRSVRRVADLLDLLVAIAIDD